MKVGNQLPTLVHNVTAFVHDRPLKNHVRDAVRGPLLVALGHDMPNGVGLGPDFPGVGGWFVWCCCFCGFPCSPPVGHLGNKLKSDFNKTIGPKKGKGISD